MPRNKSALLRYWAIDRALRNERRRFPNRSILISEIAQKVGVVISESMLFKDLHDMKRLFGAPVSYSKKEQGYYYDDREFSIKSHPFTEAEMLALEEVAKILPKNINPDIKSNYISAINKILNR